MYDEKYIKKMVDKIEKIEDEELRTFILSLIHERDLLINNANIDYLTGLNNRRILENVTMYGIVVMCDVDDFKKINDAQGHDVGDKILKLVAQVLSKNIRNNDVLCRYGGDEFLIIFNVYDINIVYNRMKQIQEQLKEISKKFRIEINISVGISKEENNKSLDTLITEADKALYKSKNEGKGKITIYEFEKLKFKN